MTTFRVIAAAFLFVVLAPAGAVAQSFEFPPGNAVPNYHRVSIGQREGLEGGAFVARTDDAGANWYNPAGLAQSENVALNASGNAYEFTVVALEGLGTKRGGAKFSSVGTFVGVVAGSPILKARWLRLGVSFTKPVAWSPPAIDGAVVGAVAGGEEQLGLYSESGFSVFVPALNAGVLVAPTLRAGLGVGFPVTNLSQTAQITDRFLRDDDQVEIVTQSFVTAGTSIGFELMGGVQWDVIPDLTVGGTVTTPSSRLSGSTRLSYQRLASRLTTASDLSFRDPEAEFDYRHPLRASAGAALRLGRFEVEADVRYTGSREAYPLYTSAMQAQLIEYAPGGTADVTDVPFTDVEQEVDSTVDVAIGGNYALSRTFRLHAGFFTDTSPVGNPETSILRAVDFTGISGGVSFGGRLSGSLGFAMTTGDAGERIVGPSISGLEATTTVEVRTWTVLYSISYAF